MPRRLPVLVVALALLAGCLGNDDTPDFSNFEPNSNLDDVRVPADAVVHEGEVTAAGTATFNLTVPEGAVGVHALVEWETGFGVDLALVDPSGTVAARGTTEVRRSAAAATVAPPAPGEWQVRVTTPFGDPVAFTARAWTVDAVRDVTVEEAVVLETGRMLELNVILEEGASFAWSFRADAPVEWDVHTHGATDAAVFEEGSGTTGEGTITAEKHGVHSFMVTVPGGDDVRLEYTASGPLRVHSRSIH